MHLLPEFVCEFDSLIESDSDSDSNEQNQAKLEEKAKEYRDERHELLELDDCSDIEIDSDITHSYPVSYDSLRDSTGDSWPHSQYFTHYNASEGTQDSGIYAPSDAAPPPVNDQDQNSEHHELGPTCTGTYEDHDDVDIFDEADSDYISGLDYDDGCDADVSSELDILEADMEDFSMDVDTSSVASAEFQGHDVNGTSGDERPEGESKGSDRRNGENNGEEDDDDDGEGEEEEGDSSPAPVIERIEDMVLLFLKQLAMPGRADEETDSANSSVVPDSDPDDDSGAEYPQSKSLVRTDYKIEIPLADRRKRGRDGNDTDMKVLRYPRKCNTGSVQSLAKLFRVLDLSHEATLNGIPATKRDIYYRDVSLFKSQRTVDELVDDIAATFDVDRSDLSIRSSSKGLVCGAGLSIELLSGETIRCKDTEGSLIPAGEDIASFSVDEDVGWVLIVEKEAVFQTLCRMKLAKHESMPGPGVIITGKGYPDVATRHLVKSLADALPKRIPVVGLVDGDPYGLDILSVYKYGSQKMRHEEGKLAARRVKWLGLWASELHGLGISKEHLLPISKHDEKKALAMLTRRDIPLPGRWKKEMQYMLHSRRKAEIEILSTKISDEGLLSPMEASSSFGDPSSGSAVATVPEAEPLVPQYSVADAESPSVHSPITSLLVRYLSTKITDAIAQKQAQV